MTEHLSTIDDAARSLRAGAITSVELARAAIARADALDERLGAYLHRTDEAALAAASRADDELSRGLDRGVLHGIPLCVKDIFATADAPTTAQSLALESTWGARDDAAVVGRLRDAGAVLTGKTTTMEFAIGIPDPEKPFPLPRNPWSDDRWAGGSSSGTAIAIATGMAFGGPGTDTGGSIRIPSAYCGTTGLKPTFGRVSSEGCFPLATSLDHVGPMARSALDCAHLLDAMAGHDPRDPHSADIRADPVADAIQRGIPGIRIGVDRLHHAADADVTGRFDDAVAELERAGAIVHEISLPHYEAVTGAAGVTMFAESFAQHRRRITERWNDYGRPTRQVLALGALVSAATYVQAQRVREVGRRGLATLFEDVDVVACLTAGSGAPSLTGFDFLSIMTLPVFAAYWNGIGFPALSLPIGFDDDGLPLAMQLAGPAWSEATVLRAGHAYQQVTDWHRQVPPVALGSATP